MFSVEVESKLRAIFVLFVVVVVLFYFVDVVD
jgi:hypothetical protein